MMRDRLQGWIVVVLVLAAGCTAQGPRAPAVPGRTDVWFMQHMVPFLRQTTSVVSLARAHLTDPTLIRLADRITRRGQADIDQLQGWLDRRGLAPHIHSHQRIDNRRQTDLERLSRLRGRTLDLAFARVMTARLRAATKLTTTGARDGSLPEVRSLARRMLAQQRAQARQLRRWTTAAA
jgi:uncharacterized protein (DUF305 family)